MSTDDSGPTVDDLAAELDRDRPVEVAALSDAPGEPIFPAGSVMDLFVLVVAARTDPPGPHGSGLIDLLKATAGLQPSPGTVYPALHDLDDAGLLTTQELVRTTHYSIADPDAADAALANYEQRLAWWLELTRTARESLETGSETDPDVDDV